MIAIKSLLVLTTIVSIICQERILITDKDLNVKVHAMRKAITGRSLLGKWKLTEDNNFVVNSKITMINDLNNQKRVTADKISFLQQANTIREVEGFFQSEEEGAEASSLYLQLLDGKYKGNSSVVLQIGLKDMEGGRRLDKNTTLWTNQNKTTFATCLLLADGIVIGKFNIAIQLQIFSNVNEKESLTNSSKIYIKLSSNSFSIYSEMQPITNEYRYLVILQVLFTFLFLVAVIKFKARESVYSISDLMILQVAAFVLVANVILLVGSLNKLDTNLWIVAVCALLNISMDFFFLRNYEDVIVNSFFVRNADQLIRTNWRRIITTLCLLLAYFIAVYSWYQSPVLWIYQSFILLGLQINYSYTAGGKGGISLEIAATIIFTRFPFFYYLFGCSQLTRQPTDLQLFVTFIGVNVTMFGFIVLQRYFGSRFIIIKELIPGYHNYFDSKIEGYGILLVDPCPICQQQLTKESGMQSAQPTKKDIELSITSNNRSSVRGDRDSIGAVQSSDYPSVNEEIKQEQKKVMVTPCRHAYHKTCLQDWMTKRLNCPMCRADLPPSEEQGNYSYCC